MRLSNFARGKAMCDNDLFAVSLKLIVRNKYFCT